MPLYEFECGHCGRFTEMRSAQHYVAEQTCPACGDAAPQVISAPNLARLSSANRIAHERNEKSAHEPRRLTKELPKETPHRCTPSCQHGKAARPWMLGH